ncbi:hypothetical protein HHK36_002818 [Tetracentron sinense]|uniref:Poly [ADP-ribose] polymerase n=1 Tax=Tetracentron sinense TaxID=13715 RepID=A0A834ZQ48_TETSI|nr:hypothetical protein HHK36_002818 [Tetracentron sinense]
MEGSSRAHLGSKIRSRNAKALSMMNRRNQARKIAERIRTRVRLTNSSHCSSKTDEQCGFASGFCSTQPLLQNFSNFKHSDAPSRFMFYQNGSWVDFSGEVFGVLKSGFLAGRPMEMVASEGSQYLFDFLRMLQIDMATGKQRSISWIDVQGKYFFPKSFVGEDIFTVPKIPDCPKIGIEAGFTQNSLKRKRNKLDSAEEHTDETSPANQPEIPKGLPLNTHLLERPRWSNVEILKAGQEIYSEIKKIFLSGLTRIDPGATITSIHRCLHLGPSGRARLEVFRKQMEITKAARGIDNTRLAWHGTSFKGVASIVNHGFGMPTKFSGSEAYGVGVYLSPRRLPQTSAVLSEADDNGEKHVVLCRVIMGRVEKIEVGSQQFHPTSADFDTGVDNPENPRLYIIWSTNMNRHILPLFVVSYKSTLHLQGSMVLRSAPSSKMLKLFSEVKNSLASAKIQELESLLRAYMAGTVANDVLIQQVRSIIGDELLRSTIRKIRSSR